MYSFLQRTKAAVDNWTNILPFDVENKIRRIGGANLHPAAQFDNLHELFREVKNVQSIFMKNFFSRVCVFQIYYDNQAVYLFMLQKVIPGIENLARELKPESFNILKAGREGKVEISKKIIAQILANGFFCNFQSRDNLPHINFDKY
jgi:Poly (ADP-ribose) glycohydrolase (PARG)